MIVAKTARIIIVVQTQTSRDVSRIDTAKAIRPTSGGNRDQSGYGGVFSTAEIDMDAGPIVLVGNPTRQSPAPNFKRK